MSNQHREVAARACERHNVIFNQSRTRESSGTQWGPWLPWECPKCSEETEQRLEREQAREKFDAEVLPEIKQRIAARSEKRFEETEGIEQLVSARADELEAQWLCEAWASNRKAFLARAKDEILAGFDMEGIEEEQKLFFEQRKQEAAATQAALEEVLEKQRDEKLTESIRGFAALA